MVGHPLKEVLTLLGELEKRGVFSRTRKGTIYNRRMIRDEKMRETYSKNGRKGGLVSAEKRVHKTQLLKQNGKQDAKPSSSPLNPIPYTQEKRRAGARKNGFENGVESGDPAQPSVPWPQRLRGFQKSGFWQPFWGPPPGEPGCFVPNHLLRTTKT